MGHTRYVRNQGGVKEPPSRDAISIFYLGLYKFALNLSLNRSFLFTGQTRKTILQPSLRQSVKTTLYPRYTRGITSKRGIRSETLARFRT